MSIVLRYSKRTKKILAILAGAISGILLGSLIGAGISFSLLPLLGSTPPILFLSSLEAPKEAPESQLAHPDPVRYLSSNGADQFLLENPALITVQNNSLVSLSNPHTPAKNVRAIKVIVTAYSSTPCQTWGDPYLTAAETWVRDGVIANNMLPFGTKVRMPELFGDKVFVVEDRMNSRKGPYHFDIWFPDYWEALNFGAKTTYIEILEN